VGATHIARLVPLGETGRTPDPMRVLLDTQVWLGWEIAIKHGLGKLDLLRDPQVLVPEWMTRSAVHRRHALGVALTPQAGSEP
jgi:hypothetical protein